MSANLMMSDVSEGGELPILEKEVKPVTVVLGAMASRDWRPQHHDYKFATERNGLEDIIMNTPNLAAWFERYITDWTGPKGRLGRMKFGMKDSIFPNDTMIIRGTVTGVETDDQGCAWASVDVKINVEDRLCTSCEARVALPTDESDNPWNRRGDAWKP